MAAIVLLHAGFFWVLSNGLSLQIVDILPPLKVVVPLPEPRPQPKVTKIDEPTVLDRWKIVVIRGFVELAARRRGRFWIARPRGRIRGKRDLSNALASGVDDRTRLTADERVGGGIHAEHASVRKRTPHVSCSGPRLRRKQLELRERRLRDEERHALGDDLRRLASGEE